MNITILVLLYPKTLNNEAITLYNIENYVTNSMKKTEVVSSRTHFEVLGLVSKVKSLALASRPQVLENWPVLGSRTALFFEL